MEEMFSTEPAGGSMKQVWGQVGTFESHKEAKDIPEYKDYQFARAAHAFKLLCRVFMVVLVLIIIKEVLVVVPQVMTAWKTGLKAGFESKEGLQYLGAGFDNLRDDIHLGGGGLVRSLAETATAYDPAVGVAAPVAAPKKATFYSREGLSSPEEELLKSQGK